MNRRAAIAWALGATVAGAAGGARLPAVGRQPTLPAALADLYDERFVGALPQTSSAAIAALVRAGIGRLQLSSDEPAHIQPSGGTPLFTGGGHLMGTTRMGTDPRRSVTDAAGRVHGFSNLYAAGASLFPAASAANPTLTIVALALRLAEHLAAEDAMPSASRHAIRYRWNGGRANR